MNLDLNLENAQKVFDITIVLSKALESLFEENKGIVLDIPENTSTFENWKKIVVYKKNDTIQIGASDEDINEGTLIEVK